MRKPCQCDGVAIANAASCQCCRSQLGIGTEDRQHWHTGNTPRPVYRQHFKNREICDDHSLQTVVITKSATVSNRFLALLYQSPSLPKLPPHFAKCGGNQKNDTLPYFLLLHLHTEELIRLFAALYLRRNDELDIYYSALNSIAITLPSVFASITR